MNIKKITGILCICIALMFSMFRSVHAVDKVTLSFVKTDTANELEVVVTGMPKTESLSLNLKVDGNVTLKDDMKVSSDLAKLGARIDTRQTSTNTLDIYVTSKNVIDTNGKIVLGRIYVEGNLHEKYSISLNKDKDGIKGVSDAFQAVQIPADDKNLVTEGSSQEIADTTQKPEEPQTPEGDKPVHPEIDKPGDTAGDDDKTIRDQDTSVTGNTQIHNKMSLHVTEVKDSSYLAMVKTSLSKISTKYKVFNINIMENGKAITLHEQVTVRMAIPKGFDRTKLKVYDIQNNNRSELAFTIEGDNIVFQISHLGNYVIAEQNVSGAGASIETGDTTQTSLYYALAGAAFVSIVILFLFREKRKQKI